MTTNHLELYLNLERCSRVIVDIIMMLQDWWIGSDLIEKGTARQKLEGDEGSASWEPGESALSMETIHYQGPKTGAGVPRSCAIGSPPPDPVREIGRSSDSHPSKRS